MERKYNKREMFHKIYFLHLTLFIKLIFREKNIEFQNKDNFWSIYMMTYYLAGSFVDSRVLKDKEKDENDNLRKVIINLPPRHYKSLIVSVIFPPWLLGVDHKIQIIAASHNRKLSEKNLYECKHIMKSNTYKTFFPDVIIDNKYNRAHEFKTEKGGYIFATSVMSGAIGIGGDFIITDDPHNPNDVYGKKKLENTINSFRNNIFSRLNDRKSGSMIVVMQRLHVNDLTGHLMKNEGWKKLSLNLLNKEEESFTLFDEMTKIFHENEVLNNEIFNQKSITDLIADIGIANFNAQYQQDPKSDDSSIIKEEMITTVDSKNTANNNTDSYIILNQNINNNNINNINNSTQLQNHANIRDSQKSATDGTKIITNAEIPITNNKDNNDTADSVNFENIENFESSFDNKNDINNINDANRKKLRSNKVLTMKESKFRILPKLSAPISIKKTTQNRIKKMDLKKDIFLGIGNNNNNKTLKDYIKERYMNSKSKNRIVRNIVRNRKNNTNDSTTIDMKSNIIGNPTISENSSAIKNPHDDIDVIKKDIIDRELKEEIMELIKINKPKAMLHVNRDIMYESSGRSPYYNKRRKIIYEDGNDSKESEPIYKESDDIKAESTRNSNTRNSRQSRRFPPQQDQTTSSGNILNEKMIHTDNTKNKTSDTNVIKNTSQIIFSDTNNTNINDDNKSHSGSQIIYNPRIDCNSFIVHSWDVANSAEKNNYTVGTTWLVKDDFYYLIDLYRKQIDYNDLRKIVIHRHEEYGGLTLIEDKANGSALIQDLKANEDMMVVPCKPSMNKYGRLMETLYLFEKKRVIFPKDAHWFEGLKKELLEFPNSQYDDQVDSITQFLMWIKNNKPKRISFSRI